ncbi:MAG: hypothetical protein JSV92_04290, partial [archaeon]
TVIIPTLDEGTEKYREILKNIIKETARPVDSGAVNQVIIMDGTGTEDHPDREFDKEVIGWAVEFSKDFKKQLEYLKSSRNARVMSKRFGFRFRYRIFNQKHPEYYSKFIEFVGPKVTGFDEIKKDKIQKGKGSVLRLSIPASEGDVICTIDSDVKSCKDCYCRGLLMPFFKERDTMVTKASYIRKNTKGEAGGRIKRLVYDPWAHAIVKKGRFVGIETLNYGTSGEFAFRRSIGNKIRIPDDFGLETSFNTQVYHHVHGNLNRVKQVDLGIFEHCSSDIEEDRDTGKDPAMEKMSEEISRAWTMAALDTGLNFSQDEFYQIYRVEVGDSIERTKEMIDKSKIARKEGVKYSEEQIELDMKRLEKYKPRIKSGINKGIKKYNTNEFGGVFPSWREIKESIGGKNYSQLKEEFSNITDNYTRELLDELKLI